MRDATIRSHLVHLVSIKLMAFLHISSCSVTSKLKALSSTPFHHCKHSCAAKNHVDAASNNLVVGRKIWSRHVVLLFLEILRLNLVKRPTQTPRNVGNCRTYINTYLIPASFRMHKSCHCLDPSRFNPNRHQTTNSFLRWMLQTPRKCQSTRILKRRVASYQHASTNYHRRIVCLTGDVNEKSSFLLLICGARHENL